MWTYEEERKQNLARVNEIIRDLGLDPETLAAGNKALLRTDSKAKKISVKPAGRKREPSTDEDEDVDDSDSKPPLKKAHSDEGSNDRPQTELRRSQRNQGKKVDYTGENIAVSKNVNSRLASVQTGLRDSEPRSVDKRSYDP